MQFSKLDSLEAAANILEQRLALSLSKHKVLWLVSGGSNIKISVLAMKQVPKELSSNLTVMLIDERYGKVGHKDSNWAQLMEGGFDAKDAKLLPVIQKDMTFTQNADYYAKLAEGAFSSNDIIIGQIGIGPDGHLAGILPGSVATEVRSGLVTHYDSEPYERLTLTFDALKQINIAYVFAFGEDKKETLTRLMNETLDLSVQPAQILKQLNEVYIYNDEIEGTV